MPTAPSRRCRTTPHLGRPQVAVISPGRYLRHRAHAQQCYQTQRRTGRLRVLCWLTGCLLFYLLIGRDLVAMSAAVSRAESAQLGRDVKTLAKDLKRIGDRRKAMADTTGQVPMPPELAMIAAEEDASGRQ